jgi:hypothetical protein
MDQYGPSTKMPELLVFAKVSLLGAVIAELSRIAYIGGGSLAVLVGHSGSWIGLTAAALGLPLVAWYVVSRGIVVAITRIARSKRLDLLLAFVLGVCATYLASSSGQKFHERLGRIDPLWVLLFASFIALMLASSLARALLARRKRPAYQMYFLTDDEIDDDADDALFNQTYAAQFAQTVLASGSNSGLVYGIDGPWGVGKTSFVNLACKYWRNHAANEVVIFRFEPLRYASDPDLAERLIRDLSGEIQRQVFVPEFRPAANRYSRMLKGKAGFSFLGFSLSLEPSAETIDELLDDIDDVLKRIDRRLIVVVDDLDRLDAKAVNDVLFTVRRTFRLTQAAYILCYDTENLVSNKDEVERARLFLEKFVNIKLSLFVDSSRLRDFLRTDWNKDGDKFLSIPSETMLKLASILSELADILDSEHAAIYMRLMGDMRKLKRFVNAVLLMQIEKTDLARTDFDRRDLINLILVHLNYPGIFRRIYVEETEGRSGIFSSRSKRVENERTYENAEGFAEFVASCTGPDKFLLDQLFAVDTLDLGGSVDESVRASRACFNAKPHRNLEKYLKLIVRFATPEPRATFRFYQDVVADVARGNPVEAVLARPEFDLKDGELAHDEFWRILVGQSYNLRADSANDSISTLVKFLPRYSLVNTGDRALRARSIYNLIRLLDRAGWGRSDGNRSANTPHNIVEIAHRIYGENKYKGHGLIDQLAEGNRGVLGLYDLILFRLQCSADRLGQVFNLHSSLIVYHDMDAPTSGLVSGLALVGMRSLSQRVFALFKARYIDSNINFFDEAEAITDGELLGDSASFYFAEARGNGAEEKFGESIEATHSMTKTFILFQLTNRKAASGSGVGCGYYDPTGEADRGEISALMNKYIFDVCFDPDVNERNAEHFLDFCLCNLTSGTWRDGEDEGYFPSVQGLTEWLDGRKLAEYWTEHGTAIKSRNLARCGKRVITWNYVATYSVDLLRLFEVLDQIQVQH